VAVRTLAIAIALGIMGAVAPAAEARPASEIAAVAVHPWRMEDPETLDRTFAGVAATGVKLVRVDLIWSVIEREPGEDDWSRMDAIAAAAARHGLRLVPVVAYSPDWANPSGDPWAYPDDQPFERFFAAALRRYPQIPAWELWNEPNSPIFGKPTPDPAGFVELLRSARRARDGVGSHAKLIAGGLLSSGSPAVGQWIDQVAFRGGLDLVDGLGIHPYSPREPDDPASWMMRLQDLHYHLAALGHPDLPLWLTEYGAPSMTVPSSYGPTLTEEQQADRLRRAFAVATRWPWVENLTWYEYRDGCSDRLHPECNFGVVREDLSPKPAYRALQEVVAGRMPALRSRLSVVSRVRGARLRLTVRGRLMLPGRPRPSGRIVVRVLGRAGRSRPLLVPVRAGAFRALLRAPRGRRWTVVARYGGSRGYRPALARARVRR
jgi:polysaccharide biosynthesis protein PslG